MSMSVNGGVTVCVRARGSACHGGEEDQAASLYRCKMKLDNSYTTVRVSEERE